ncbi:MAG: DnaJ domain-containing protein [Lachnospiraceae bacterium]|nr:DnaJ domain-containing protein [Lachnospiraceae bacterium]
MKKMANDPYQVLGVNRNASDEEIKKAYRELSRKYHPDSYEGNPLADLAEEKFREVQDAYDEIMKFRGGSGNYGDSYGNQGYQSAGGYDGRSSGTGESLELQNVYHLIIQRRFREALNALNAISNRNARWFYYSAVSNLSLGNKILALSQARQASMMEPGNADYAQLVAQIEANNNTYVSNRYRSYDGGPDIGKMCCDLWIADTLCECMGGDLCRCM